MKNNITVLLSNKKIEINVTTSEFCRKLIRELQQEKMVYHTYKTREARAFRVVIGNLHHSVTTDEI
jgi:hypothetical protein